MTDDSEPFDSETAIPLLRPSGRTEYIPLTRPSKHLTRIAELEARVTELEAERDRLLRELEEALR